MIGGINALESNLFFFNLDQALHRLSHQIYFQIQVIVSVLVVEHDYIPNSKVLF
jgi:hypothetical protein